MRKITRLQIQELMNECWNVKEISKETLYEKCGATMSQKRIDSLLRTMVRRHYLHFNGSTYRATVTRTNFKLGIDLVNSGSKDANPNVISQPNQSLRL